MKCPVCNKNIPDESLKCPYCKTRTGLLCSHCNTINPVGSFVCKNCGTELLKICPHCRSVNFPGVNKCRKCGLSFNERVKSNKRVSEQNPSPKSLNLQYVPKLFSSLEAIDVLSEGLKSKDKFLFSITGNKGAGKSTLLKKLIEHTSSDNYCWGIGTCSQLTQLTPGGVIQNMFLNLFNLPVFSVNKGDFKENLTDFIKKEFKFLNSEEIDLFFNFLYNLTPGEYEDIIINKKATHNLLNKIFESFISSGKFIIVIDNFDYIDGFSIEFFTHFINRKNIKKNLKLIAIYSKPRPISSYFDYEGTLDINLAPLSIQELNTIVKFHGESGLYITDREKEVIFSKGKGNPAYVEQAVGYSFDCQCSDKVFILPQKFSQLIKERLKHLKKVNIDAYKFLCSGAILGDRINLFLIKEIFGYEQQQYNDIIIYLEKASYIKKYNENYYEFSNLYLWETILKNITKDTVFEEINLKLNETIQLFNLNTSAIMAMIAHNLQQNMLSFEVWTKITRLASYVGDVNLYVIAQKQCLALLNEFNEDETFEIRSNISERLGKLLTEYDPEEALEYLPDAISFANDKGDDTKEVELLGYLTLCCRRVGNYYGNVECIDSVLKKIPLTKELEIALLNAIKLPALLNIGNCGEIINIIDNDVLPVLDKYISSPKLQNTYPLGFLYDTRLKTYLILANALTLQGNNRSFEILDIVFNYIDKYGYDDKEFYINTRLTKAFASTIKGNYSVSEEILKSIKNEEELDKSRWNLLNIINRFLQKDYNDIQSELFDAVTYANNCGDNFTKNILKVLLGRMFMDKQDSKRAMEIYNEQITYFAKEKMAIGALLSWFLIAQSTDKPKTAIEIAEQALEIAQNPKIYNNYFIIKLKMILAKSYFLLKDYQSARMHIESALSVAKRYELRDLIAQLYIQMGEFSQVITNNLTPESLYKKALQSTSNPYLIRIIEDKIKNLN